jgi:hypothetical protein
MRGTTANAISRRQTPVPRGGVYELYWIFAARRQAAFEQRLAGEPAPWTDDPILQIYKFCRHRQLIRRSREKATWRRKLRFKSWRQRRRFRPRPGMSASWRLCARRQWCDRGGG